MRTTRQRAAVRDALDRAGAFRTAQHLHDELKAAGESVGLTTVYRTLQGLADAGEVDVLRTADGEAIYRRCATGEHHHHLVCRSCGSSVEVASDEVERWAAATAELHGFTEVQHTAELYGLCGACAPR
jgi:Fur family ferric uptake transcriptional regulator